MKKPKQLFNIFQVTRHNTVAWDGQYRVEKILVGKMRAVSEAQAVAWWCYKAGARQFSVIDEWADCCTTCCIEAELAIKADNNGEQLSFL